MQEFPDLLNKALENPWVKFTEYFILGLIVLIIIVDIVLAVNGKPEDTISEVIIKAAYGKFAVLTWVWGVLAGHFFLAKSEPILGRPNSILTLIGLTGIAFLIGLLIQENLFIQIILLSLGIIAGYLLWPQNI